MAPKGAAQPGSARRFAVPAMNSDRIARIYRWVEYLSFGGALQACRVMYLKDVAGRRRALLCGDGDGRFLAELLRTNREVCVDFVDLSAGMVGVAQRRVGAMGPEAGGRTNFHVGDLRKLKANAGADYDLIATHFFLDCFDERDTGYVARRLASVAGPPSPA